ncbi:MAG: PAS domain-containing protein, partial [Anaerolineales bacterium]|nr:PAS domain-containing protein [Anaerolineales bacterium]
THRLESLIQSMVDGLVLEDLEGRVLYANRRIEELSSMGLEEIVGSAGASLMARILVYAQEQEQVAAQIAEAEQQGGQRRVQFTLLLPDKTRHLRLTLFDVVDSQGTLIGHGRILRDITQRYELDRMKSSLISTVSHELRTPLAAIKGYATTLLADDVQWDEASEREFLSIISVEADHLSALVNDLLDMSRIESGSLTVSRIHCDLPDLVQQAALHSHPRLDGRLQTHLPPDLPSLYADPKRVTAVLRNLIENAAKYTDEHLPIHVSAAWDAAQVVVRVADEGPGIPTVHQGQIFNSFYRVDNSMTRRATGAGLGLAISRGFVQAHGGDIWVEPQDVGLCVAFSLPFNAAEE